MSRRLVRGLGPGAALLLILVAPMRAQESAATSEVFRRYAGRVVKIQVTESSSAAKASIGSGFHVSPDGHVITNYHVISSVVTDPDRYQVDVISTGGEQTRGTVVAIDVVHDLAVLSVGHSTPSHLTLGADGPPQGSRVYALGHPHDLGLAIVEGTHNGRREHALYDRIHFTGSLNPGMSGGPAITADGVVMGINVSTAGDQISFLVPAERAGRLLERVRAPGYARPEPLLAAVTAQILEHQDAYLAGMFEDPPTTTLGSYVVPTQPAGFFRCWADVTTSEAEPYRIVDHQCSTDDYVFIAGEQSSGVVELRHRLMTSDELDRFRMSSLLEFVFMPGDEDTPGDREHVTSFRCRTGNVESGRHAIRAAFCLRRYRKLEGLYDAVVKTVTLGDRQQGVVSTLTLAGVSATNARLVAQRFLESIRWKE
ncbi:MAG: serine protease [Gemmatimonadota bacterium]|nr:serine protease [Gemmatimonadota bacterium]